MPEASSFYLSLVSFSPRLGWDTNVGVRPNLELRFSHQLNTQQVTTDAQLNQYFILTRMTDDQSLPVTFVSWDAPSKILTIAPSGDLVAGGLYQVTLRKTLTNSTGRALLSDRTWSFQVSAAALGQVELDSPGDSTAFTSPPSLIWTGVWIPSGVVNYQIQLDDDWQFGESTLWASTVTVSGSGGMQAVNIGASLNANQVYYWRVRARTQALTGEWSETRSFHLGSDTAASPDTVASYHPDRAFRLTDLIPPNGLSNLSAWPTLRATFSQPLSGGSVNQDTVALHRSAVDGDVATGTSRVSGTISLYTNRIEFTPDGTIANNSRYSFTLGDGLLSTGNEALPESLEIYFTGPYAPLYGGPIAVRALLGGFIDDVSDDEILFHLWRGSLESNELSKRSTSSASPTDSFTEADLVAYRPSTLTWGIVRYAELTAAMALVRRQYYELLQRAGAKAQIGAFSYDLDVKVLKEIRDHLDGMQQQRGTIAATYLQNGAAPATSMTLMALGGSTAALVMNAGQGSITRVGLRGLGNPGNYRTQF